MVEMRANLQPRISTAQTPMPRPPPTIPTQASPGVSHVSEPGQRVVVEEEFSRLVPLKVLQLPGERRSNNYDVVLGMDFLSHCTFTLRGPDRQFQLDLAGPRPHHSIQDKKAQYRSA